MTTKQEMVNWRNRLKIIAIKNQAKMLYEIKKEPTKAFIAYVIAYLIENKVKGFEEFTDISEEVIVISIYNEPEFVVSFLQKIAEIEKKYLDEIFTHCKDLFLKIE